MFEKMCCGGERPERPEVDLPLQEIPEIDRRKPNVPDINIIRGGLEILKREKKDRGNDNNKKPTYH